MTGPNITARNSKFRGPVAPAPDGMPRPLWSVMIPAFNCRSYLAETLACVIAQDPGPKTMQIQVVDDHSTDDDPHELVRAIAGDRVEYYRQQANRGVVGNLNTCINLARGQIIHLLHGDDLVEQGYYARMTEVFESNPEIGAAFCRHVYIDARGEERGSDAPFGLDSGIIDDPTGFLGVEQRIMTPSISVRRRAYEALGGFDRRLKYAEDWEMWMRIASSFPIYYLDEALARYRMHDQSNSGRSMRKAISDTRNAIRIFSDYYPAEQATPMRNAAMRTYARSALGIADRLLENQDPAGAAGQLWVAFRMHCTAEMFREVRTRASKIGALSRKAWFGSR